MGSQRPLSPDERAILRLLIRNGGRKDFSGDIDARALIDLQDAGYLKIQSREVGAVTCEITVAGRDAVVK